MPQPKQAQSPYFKMCPRCGSNNFTSTLMGTLADQDPNSCFCIDCGCRWEGVRADTPLRQAAQAKMRDDKERQARAWNRMLSHARTK